MSLGSCTLLDDVAPNLAVPLMTTPISMKEGKRKAGWEGPIGQGERLCVRLGVRPPDLILQLLHCHIEISSTLFGIATVKRQA